MRKKFGPIEISNEDQPGRSSPDVFIGHLMQIIGVLYILELGLKSIQGEPIETYGTITGWVIIAGSIFIIRSQIRRINKESFKLFIHHFGWIKRKR